MGIEKNKIREALETFVGLPHRLQFVAKKYGVKYINDSKATNPDSVTKALCAFKNIHWICGGREKEGSPLTLKDSLEFVKKAYIIGEHPVRFASKLGNLPYTICGTMDVAIRCATDAAKAGDVILLSPAAASFDQYKNFEKRGEHFIRLVGKIP